MRVAGLLRDELGDASAGVAAGLGLAAIGVENAHEGLRRSMARRLDQDQLVAADAGAPVGERARDGGVDGEFVPAPVEHDKIVAEPMHLAERDMRRGLRHGEALYGGAVSPVQRAPTLVSSAMPYERAVPLAGSLWAPPVS
jgi:hypothetical protein